MFLFFTRDRNCFCKKQMQEKPPQTKHSAPAASPVGRDRFKMAGKDDAKLCTVTFITFLALCRFRDFSAFQPVYQSIGISGSPGKNPPVSAECVRAPCGSPSCPWA